MIRLFYFLSHSFSSFSQRSSLLQTMLGAPPRVRTVPVVAPVANQTNAAVSVSNPHKPSRFQLSLRLISRTRGLRRPKMSTPISCRSSSGERSSYAGDHDHEYLQAFVLVSETMRHFRMLKGFEDDTSCQPPNHLPPFNSRAKETRKNANPIGSGFLRRFQNPAIFLKITCDEEFVLPIFVGETAVERLISALRDDENGVMPNQYQFARNLVEKLGYEVKMVKITERVVNTYFARIYFSKPGEDNYFSVDARPSDAINLAYRCEAPICVNKQIVLTDALRILYGVDRAHNKKAIYDVSLDSAVDGPDSLVEELDLVRNMIVAVEEERYKDAAMWRDKLGDLRKSTENQ